MSEKRQTSKIFVGGLSWETTDQRLRTYFENYGAVSEAFVSFDRVTGRPRGFGFVVFEDPTVADKVVSIQHTIDRREVEAKKAVPKEDNPAGRTASGSLSQRTKKIFVGGLAPSVDEQAFRKYFEQYGEVEDAVVMYDHDNKRPRGFGFVTFKTEEGVDEVFVQGALQTLHDKPIEIKRAVPRDQIASARGRSAVGQQMRLDGAPSGFAAAAMGPSFGDDGAFANNLLHSHSMGTNGTQPHTARLGSATSLGGALPPAMFNDLQQLGLSQQLYQALSGQISTQLSGQLSPGLTLPNHTSGLQNGYPMNSMNLAHAGSARLPTVGSQHLPSTLAQHSALQQLGSSQLPPMGAMNLHHMGSEQLAPAGSGLLQRNGLALNGYGSGLQNGMGQDFRNQTQDYSQHGPDYSQAQNYNLANQNMPNQYNNIDNVSAFSNAANDYGGNSSHSAFANNNSAFANGGSHFANITSQPSGIGLEKAFSNMGLENKASLEANLPPPSGFEERVNMLSAGSAGLGQLTSPKLPTSYGKANYEQVPDQHHQQTNQQKAHDLPVATQAW